MNNNQDDSNILSETPDPISANPSSAPTERLPVHKKTSFKQAAIIVGIFLVGITAGAASMYLYEASSSDAVDKNQLQTNESAADSGDQTGLPKDNSELAQETSLSDSWRTYTDPDSKYSFRYADSWTLKREARQNTYNKNDPTEYERINLLKDDKIIVMFDYPFEMMGCGSPIDTLPYEFGEHTVTMVDPCGGVSGMAGKQYMVLFENPKTKPSILTENEWPKLRLSYYTDTDNEQTFTEFKEFAKSIKGITPAKGN
jgi:hypothetical protein